MKHEFERYCKEPEKIENYEKAKKDNFKGWHCHHRLETHNSDGERRPVDIPKKELKALGMYYNRPASELIFLPESEHNAIRKVSDETRRMMGESKKGEKNPNYGKPAWNKGKKMSEEFCRKLREARKGKHHTEETRRKMGEAHKGKNIWTRGRHWFNNGKINIRAKECPPGFVPGMLK